MLYITAQINDIKIEVIKIQNLGRRTLHGRYRYKAWTDEYPEEPVEVFHKRADGWRKLAIKVIKKLSV